MTNARLAEYGRRDGLKHRSRESRVEVQVLCRAPQGQVAKLGYAPSLGLGSSEWGFKSLLAYRIGGFFQWQETRLAPGQCRFKSDNLHHRLARLCGGVMIDDFSFVSSEAERLASNQQTGVQVRHKAPDSEGLRK